MRRMDVTIVEVSPRDGLQNEPVILSTDAKVELVARLVAAGARRVEAVSFAHPKLVPAMADAEAVMARVPRADGVAYAGLVLNRRGLDRALDSGVDEVNMVVCVSDTFNRRNQNASTAESMEAAADVLGRARSTGCSPPSPWRPRSAARSRARSTRAGWPSWPPGGGGRSPGAVPGRHHRGRGAVPGP